MANIAADTFNRADSATLGTCSDGIHTWTEADGGGSISSNVGIWTGTNGANTPRAYFGISKQKSLSIRFTSPNWATVTAGSVRFVQTYALGGNRDGYGMTISSGTSNNVNLDDNGTNKATGSFTFSAGTSYEFEIDINSDNTASIYIWATGGSKGAATTTNSTAFTPGASGTNFLFGNSDNNATVFRCEDLTIDDLPVSVANTANFFAFMDRR